jgi:WD40 repeat protein
MKKLTLYALFVSVMLVACQPGYRDLSRELSAREIYHLPTGTIMHLAWPEDQTILIDIDEGEYPRYDALNITNLTIQSISVESTCKRPFSRSLQILPDLHAGFLLACPNVSQIIQEVDLGSGITKDLLAEPHVRFVANFTYSPDMSKMVLVDSRGLWMDSNLVFIDSNEERSNITQDFQRADFPVWSPTKDVVAFLGTKPYPGSDDQKQTWGQVENLLDYPWKLYLFSPSNKEVTELPVLIVHPGWLTWSPDGSMLAFTGAYAGTPGTWIITNVNTPEKLSIVRVVNGISAFAFSPDNKSMAFAYTGLQNKNKQNTIYVVDITALDSNP